MSLQESKESSGIIYKSIKVILACVLLYILYLFALNNRYYKVGNTGLLDKWNYEIISITKVHEL